MKVSSPVGDYEYSVDRVRREGASLLIDGHLGVWETTMTIEPRDWARPVALLGAVVLARRLIRR
jgi:hypothetical protein